MRDRIIHQARVILASLILTCGTGCFCDFMSYHEDVDIRTGRVKTATYLLFLPVCTRTYDTAITRSLPEERLKGIEPEWQKVNTFRWLLQVSPHYAYHGATGELRDLELATKRITFTPEALREVALQTTELWQTGSGDGTLFLDRVNEAAMKAHSNGKMVFAVSDLPGRSASGPSP